MNKPTINRTYPPDRATWSSVVELLEIIVGRRKNKIEVPALTVLTFSNPPTQAEVQALYQYVNRVRESVASLLERLQD